MSEAKVTKGMTVQEVREAISKPRAITLPSGLRMMVKRLTPLDYLNDGITTLPNEFFSFLVALQQGTLSSEKNSDEDVKKNFEIFEQFIVITLEKGVIEPTMMFKYDKSKAETHLLYSELGQEDQAFLISEIIGKTDGK